MKPDLEEKYRRILKGKIEKVDQVSTEPLDPLPYPHGDRDIWVEMITEEFTHLCPLTGLPDSGKLIIRYLPKKRIVELKSLKFYLLQFRQVGIFYEQLVPLILTHMREVLEPRAIVVRYEVLPRGGIRTIVEERWEESGKREKKKGKR
jgi:7-cyano-7-deazaguanine reductase